MSKPTRFRETEPTAGSARTEAVPLGLRRPRWHERAFIAAIACAALVVGLAATGLARAHDTGLGSVVLVLSTLALAALATAAIALARRLRGRTALVDLVHPLLWLVPWQVTDLHPVAFAAIGATSAGWIAVTCGFQAFRCWTRNALRAIDQRRIGLAVACLLVWLSKALFPEAIATHSADDAWGKALAWVMSHRLRAGVDYAFTHGPLGYVTTVVFDRDLFWIRVLVFEGLFRLAVSAFLVIAATRIRGPLERALYLALLLALPVPFDSWMLVASSAITIVLLDDAGRRRALLVLGLALLATISLTKLTFAMLALASVGALALAAWRDRSLRQAGFIVSAYLAFGLAGWLALGQSLTDIPSYVRWSLEISSGYNEAESTLPPRAAINTWGYLVAGSFALLLLIQATARPRTSTLHATSAAAAIGFFVAIKAGFVRASDHTLFFFAWAALAGFYVLLPADVTRWRTALAALARTACATCAVIGWAVSIDAGPDAASEFAAQSIRSVQTSARRWLDLRGFERELRAREARESLPYDLPRTRALVGDATIDMVSNRLGLVFVNDLAWHPRPVFQSFVTFTPDLLELNARFYESARAPEFVLFRFATIDQRLPTMDDGLVLQTLVRDYEPVLVENAILLLRRAQQRAPRPERRLVIERTIGFGEPVDLGALAGPCHVLELAIEYTFAGRLETALKRAPPLWMEIADQSGMSATLRIVPGMLRTGAIIDPILLDHDQWLDWIANARGARPARLTIQNSDLPAMYEPRIGLKLWRDDSLAQHPREALRRAVDPVLYEPAPDRIEAAHAPHRDTAHGLEVLLVHAPSRVEYPLQAGSHRLGAVFGLHPQAYERSDGAVFSVFVEQAGLKTRTLTSRTLEPRVRLQDRGPKAIQLDFTADAPCKLVLSTDPGIAGESACDWTYWSRVRVE